MTIETWLAFCATETVLCFIPGPAVLFVLSMTLARGARAGLAGAVGILAANVGYFALSATGIAAVILASHELFMALKWAGAAYLVWMGLGMLFSRSRPLPPPSPRLVRRTFLRGLVVQGANPKALVFFVALLPQFIDPNASVPLQILVLGISSTVLELGVLTLYVVTAARAREMVGSGFAARLERIGGVFLVAAGARLALVRSH
jgi:threonine/homoserine/homoserine lactone efflux protein